MLKIARIKDVLGASVVEANEGLDIEVDEIYASDLMSDVLAFGKPNSLLLTGLATQQAIISAHMARLLCRRKNFRHSWFGPPPRGFLTSSAGDPR